VGPVWPPAAPLQPPLFAAVTSLVRIRPTPTRNEWRYCRMEIWPGLFGRAVLWSAYPPTPNLSRGVK